MTSLVDEDSLEQKPTLKPLAFLFFMNTAKQHSVLTFQAFEKLVFKLKDDRNHYTEKYGENKNVHLNFCSMDNEMELAYCLQDLKKTCQEFKTRMVFYSSESGVLRFFVKAKMFNIHIESIPFCIYTCGIHADLSNFLGWTHSNITSLSSLSVNQIEHDVRMWVESPTQKIDLWAVQIKVGQQGKIRKVNADVSDPDLGDCKTHKQYFMSNLSIGYHPQLLEDFEQKKSRESSFFNKFLFSVQGIKKFCCVGTSDMKQATGVIRVDFQDQKGSHQILKEFKQYTYLDQSDEIHPRASKDRRKILSILLSNIDRFLGMKVKNNTNSRMNDQKLQLLTFQSINDSTKLASASGKITMNFSPQNPVFLHVNDACYQLEHPEAITVQIFGQVKAIINKQTLSC